MNKGLHIYNRLMPKGKGYGVEKGADRYVHSLLQSYRKNVSFFLRKRFEEEVSLLATAS